jgi:crotonobetainyl-CoA:carnitine CoA-transferase CaiB-like acyl-CoA transferase
MEEIAARRLGQLSAHLASNEFITPNTHGKGPLTGVKIVDCTEVISGPFAAAMLCDMGADVCKVENPKSGDMSRMLGTVYKNIHGERISSMFAATNRGKKSIAVNSKTVEGRSVILELAAKADVFMQNWRPGVAKKLGLDYESVRAANPRLVYLSIDGVGPDGPLSGQKVFDPVIQVIVKTTQQANVRHQT